MNLNEEYITELVEQILADIKLEYYKDKSFVISFDEPDEFDMKNGFRKPWYCSVHTHDWQFDSEEGIFSFIIDDEDLELIFFIDASGGQVPHAFIKKDENGKYFREYILR